MPRAIRIPGGCLEAELISTTLLVHCLAVSCWGPFYIFRFFNVSVGSEISTLKSNIREKFCPSMIASSSSVPTLLLALVGLVFKFVPTTGRSGVEPPAPSPVLRYCTDFIAKRPYLLALVQRDSLETEVSCVLLLGLLCVTCVCSCCSSHRRETKVLRGTIVRVP